MKNVVLLFSATALMAFVGVVKSDEKKGDKKVPAVLNFTMNRLVGESGVNGERRQPVRPDAAV
jgi:hypothetical protein